MIEFVPLRPGTIRDLFSGKRNAPKKPGYDPLGLPSIPSQCIHVETEELGEGYETRRCIKDSDPNLRHGWLCSEHGADFYAPTRREYRDKDAEVVAGILAYEKRALAVAVRIVVNVGPKTRITYCG